MDPATLYVLLGALAAKGYGSWRENKHSQEINRRRGRATRDAREQSKQEFMRAMEANRKSLDTYKPDVVRDARQAEGQRLGSVLSEIPRQEYAVADPTMTGEPTVITNAKAAAREQGLGDIMRYSQDLGNLTASTGPLAFQTNQALDTRADVMESGRRQQEELRKLQLILSGLDPYSQEAHMSNQLGDILMAYGLATV